MLYNVSQLLRQATGATRHFQIDEPSEIDDPELHLVGPIRGYVDLLRTPRGILAHTQLNQTVRVECARCLSEMSISLEIDFEEEYLPTIDLRTGVHIQYTEEDDADEAILIDERHILDLREVTRQELLLALPIRPLCRPDCAGLCPTCGADRSQGRCGCAGEDVDPRWTALAALKNEWSDRTG